jgi:hypothetical protein
MKTITVTAYDYAELNQEAKTKVKHWLDGWPLEVENDAGEFEYDYFSDMTDEDIQDHCEVNGYLFSRTGRSVHHLKREAA